MKKLLALLLSVIMAASLAVPAFAAEPEEAPVDGGPGFWLENGLPAPIYTPGDAIPISAIWDDESVGIIGGPDGPTVIIPGGPTDDDLEWWTEWRTAEDEYLSSHPGLEEQLRANAYSYFDQEYSDYYESAQEYMEIWDLTEEEFLDKMVWEQVWELICEEEWQKTIDAEKGAMGGVPGQIGVMLNGKYIQFPDAAPEAANNRAMAPVRAMIEAMGGKADYRDDQVICETDSVRLTFTLGSNEVLVEYPGGELPGDGQIFPMDCAPYVKDNRTYVPVRFVGELLGCAVGWDSAYETAVLTDTDALAAEIDKEFTVFNRVAASQAVVIEEGKGYRTDIKGNASVTAFDTLHGNKNYQMDLTGKGLFNTEAVNGSYSFTLSDNAVDALAELVSNATIEYDMDYAALARIALNNLKDMEIIINREGLAWVRIPALDELAGVENAWYGADMGAELGELLFAGVGADATMGSVIAGMVDTDSVTAYAAVNEMVRLMAGIYGDGKFTTAGGVSALTFGLDDLAALDPDSAQEIRDAYKEYEFTMKVDEKGGVTVSCAMETASQPGVPAVRVTMEGAQDGRSAELTMVCHVANVGEIKLTLTTAQQAADEKPAVQPPEGAVIVDTGVELLNP